MSNSEAEELTPRKQHKTPNREEVPDCAGGIIYSGNNEEEYLRAIWTKLGVGQDGYLSVQDLTKVCHAIGMGNVAPEVIEQLFSGLDVDGDGRISFGEFLHMFQNGGPGSSTSISLDESVNQDISLLSNSSVTSTCLPPTTSSGGMLLNEFGMFSSLDPEGTGQVSVNRLVEVWFSLGISDGSIVLRDLGLPHRHGERVRLKDLSAAFEDEWRPQQQDGSSSSSRQAALLTLIYEVKGLRMSLEAARGERDKCRWDLNEANNRLVLLVQELDDHNAQMEEKTRQQIQNMEKQYKDHVRELQESLAKERDSGTEKALDEAKEILNLNMQLQEEETKLQRRIVILEKDIKRLEIENVDLCERLKEANQHLTTMEKQITQLNQLKSKVAEYESLSPREDEFRLMMHRVAELTSENQKLRDNNDELLSQMDSCRLPPKSEDRSLDGSCIGDYFEQSCDLMMQGGIKRRVFRGSGEDDSSGPEEESPRESKIRKKCSTRVKGATVHCVDVTTYDESFVDSSLSSCFSKGTTGSVFCQPQVFTRDSRWSSPQPSSLPLTLSRSSPSNEDLELRKRLDKQKKVQELEKEVESLRQEKEKLNKIIRSKFAKKDTKKEHSVEECSQHFSPRNVSSSTPIKPPRKCLQCKELESRLTLTMEELDMALQRETQFQNTISEEREMALKRQQLLIVHCKELEEELTKVKNDFEKLCDQRDQLEKNNEELQLQVQMKSTETVTDLIEHLCQELTDKIQRKRQMLVCSSVETVNSSHLRDKITTILEEEEPEEGEEEERTERSSIFDEEMEVTLSIVSKEEKLKDEMYKLEMQINFYEEDVTRDRDYLEKQKAIVQERCIKSENDLENLRCEFEKSEDYWNLKLQEEQDYYDEERKLYDEKFISLEAKIREYEDLLLTNPAVPTEISAPNANNSDDSDRLSTIDESVLWEKQVNELEEELHSLRQKHQKLVEECDTRELFWGEKLSGEQRNSLLEISRLKHELEHSKTVFNALESEANATREQLEYLQASFTIKQSSQNSIQVNRECIHKSNSIPMDTTASEELTKSEESLISNLRCQLNLATKRLQQLENTLKIHQTYSRDILNITHDWHQLEIQSEQTMMASTQQMFSANLAKYKDQLTKATRGDLLVRELYLENTQLMTVLQVTEARQKEAENSARKYQMAALSRVID